MSGGPYVADVRGKYRNARTAVGALLLAFFLVLPWLRIGGHPVLLLDVIHGRFSVFGFAFWAHDVPLLVFGFLGAALTLALVTAVWGRTWCGWACPQTVFVTQVFRRIERIVEGDAFTRRRRDEREWDAEKTLLKAVKWSLFVVVALILSHSFLAYFVGSDAVARMIGRSPAENPGTFAAMLALSGLVLADFGWIRERFCVVVCPYGRFQSVLMDPRSLIVAYDRERTDCVDCKRCVQVCPTGIDIRNGLQMECVACTSCIDACDTVMTRLKKPTGLIRYRMGRSPSQWFTGRALAYLLLLTAALGAFFFTISSRQPLEVVLTRSVGAPYEEIAKEGAAREIVNRFKLDLLNQSFEEARISLGDARDGVRWVSAAMPIRLGPGESRRVEAFASFPVSRAAGGHGSGTLEIRHGEAGLIVKEVPLVGPYR